MGISDAFSVVTVGSRHAVAPSLDFGLSAERYNAQDKYRNEYSDSQRTAAGIGATFGAALPAAGLLAYGQKNMRSTISELGRLADVPALRGAGSAGKEAANRLIGEVARTGGTKAAGMLWLGGATVAGTAAAIRLSGDDGNLAAPLGAAGIVGGGALGIAASKIGGVGSRMGNKVGLAAMGIAGIGGGIAGHIGGSKIEIGESKIGKKHEQAPYVDDSAADRVGSFARGATNHFLEVGPVSTGMSLGGAWGMNETYKDGYTNSERAGAMHGDLAATAILGGGALAVLGAATGAKGFVPEGLKAGVEAASDVAMSGSKLNATHRALMNGARSNGTAAGMGAAGLGIMTLSASKLYEHSIAQGDSQVAAATIAGGTVAATGATAVGISRASFMKSLSGGNKFAAAANSTLAAAALIGAASSAQMPIRQFIKDARSAHEVNPDVNLASAGIASAVGAAAGGVGAFKGLTAIIPDDGFRFGKVHLPKYGAKIKPLGIVGVGTALGAAALGAAGYGLAATMPDPLKVGISTGVGAAAGTALGAVVFRGRGALAGGATGAGLGLSASAIAQD